MNNKDIYRQHCKLDETIPIFSQDWWLDATCGDNWDVCLIIKDNEILASMPYYMKKKFGFKIISMPPLTQNLGPWLKNFDKKNYKKLSLQKELMNSLIQKLPKYDYFAQNWHYNITNWLPFYWKEFKSTTKYTYVIENLLDMDLVWKNFQDNIKGDVKKAKNRFNLIVKTDLPINEFIKLTQKTYERQKILFPFDFEFLKNFISKMHDRNQCKWFIAQDGFQKNHAGVLIVWDKQSAHYLMGGGNPNLRNSGATSLCLWEAIKFSSTVTNKFDFEGSMIEGIERFFRGFGAIQKPYFHLKHEPTKSLKIIKFIKQIFKA